MDAHQRLKEWRGSRSLREAALDLGCHETFIGLLEKRKRTPGRDMSLLIARVVGIPAEAWSQAKAAPKKPRRKASRSVHA